VFEKIEGETAEDGKGFCGASSSDAQVILHSAIALTLQPRSLSDLTELV
jgi:hypothetical protein